LQGRLTVVLDMDETLIHSDFIDPADIELYRHRKETSYAFLEGVEGVFVSRIARACSLCLLSSAPPTIESFSSQLTEVSRSTCGHI
jgi:hypothetical protein